jgi:regulation of enolase protein 1 (concanavalin A-like superfamily)
MIVRGKVPMPSNRRTFLEQSLVVAGVAVAVPELLAKYPTIHLDGEGDLASRMTWLNEPASWKKSGEQLVVRSRPKTDFWSKTFYGYVTDNGHFFHLPVSGDFVFQGRVNGQYAALYDQAGLMVRLDAENWMKCGTEFFDGQRHASVVFTRDFSDWSTMPDLSNTAPVWWRAIRKKDSIETHCSLDGKNFTAIRQGYFPPAIKVEVGIMCAAPEGPGFEAVFDHLKLDIG